MTVAVNRLLLPLDRQATLPSLQLARTPTLVRRVARLLLGVLVLLPAILLLVPWTQTVHGTGRAIAFNPVQRPQYVVSPIEGRVKKWYVVEGDRVKAGQRIVELVDNDPNLEMRLLDEEAAIYERLRAAEARVRDIEARIRNLENSRQLAIAVQTSFLQQEQARLQAFEQELIEARASYDAALPNRDRLLDLEKRGLASKRDLEVAIQTLETAQAKVKAAEARVHLGKAGVIAAQNNLSKIDADTAAMINLEMASKRAAEAEVANIRRDLTQMQVRIARQRAQYVDSPIEGTVFRLLAAGEAGGILVRPGERLAILVPDIKAGDNTSLPPGPDQMTLALGSALMGVFTDSFPGWLGHQVGLLLIASGQGALTPADYPGIVAELQIDGNDLPLVRKGDPVRLQFEGWPAVQFLGWPSVAVGTFGGRVYLVDPTADDKGRFRILVEPDPNEPPWPDQQYLRQGVRAQCWVLLSRVSLGWELWRQLNSFPVVREMDEVKKEAPLGPVQVPRKAKK